MTFGTRCPSVDGLSQHCPSDLARQEVQDDSGATTRYADSVYGTTFWPWSDDVPGHSYIDSDRFEWLMSNNSKGYIW